MLPDRLGGAENMKSVLATGRRISRGHGGRGEALSVIAAEEEGISRSYFPLSRRIAPLNVVRSTVDNFLPLSPSPPPGPGQILKVLALLVAVRYLALSSLLVPLSSSSSFSSTLSGHREFAFRLPPLLLVSPHLVGHSPCHRRTDRKGSFSLKNSPKGYASHAECWKT